MKHINKDITTVEEGLVIHGVNCQAVMGSGVALAIRNKWPIVYERYLKNGKGSDLLGSTHIISVDENLYVANCYTQDTFGGDPRVKYASLDAVRESLDGVFSWASTLDLIIYTPLIGCGLGGLDWKDVEKIFEEKIEEYGYDSVIVCHHK